jgi:peptide/nickel transport system substrate-binding protein
MALMAGGSARHFPKEMVEEHGDMSDWRNACGTGAFMLTDVVPGSTITYSKNPDYWMKDPVNTGNTLPYVDVVKQFVIPDQSTMLSAFRTGKLDIVHELLWEDKDSLLSSEPSLETSQKISSPYCVYARLDKDLPFNDIRVRQAMNLAVNQQELVDDYYEGNAALFAYPYPDSPDHSSFFIPLEDLPSEPTVEGSECSARELFGHDIEKAKQLLADAGYPDGFVTSVVCQTSDADFLSIIKEYLLTVNIDLKIDALEFSIYNSTQRGRNHEELLLTEVKTHSFPFRMLDVIPGQVDNVAFVDDPMLTSNYAEILKYVGKDDAKVAELIRGVTPYRLENS